MKRKGFKITFIKDSDTLPRNIDNRKTTIKDNSITTDYKSCRENAETALWIRFLKGVNWETFTHDELKKVFDIVGDIVVAKEKEQ